ncbi:MULTISPECIES: hypothetical protein [Amycolatopsis]|uniref:Hemerythrin HHE cation binding domain-containing protein n=1 Tax=Amycolatopsis echigonensis TaxID=2576905 RepID=A0A2N3WLG6_9PSEU|nr:MULTISPECIES: hypothetical protein [Amycolatopsis]MBB2500812.1 hypothetical protein [Amycolatopsis echigonensis]MCG3751231.1 hypothetical protein [Amycolatopsis sp. Poz14]PKV94695.1 hypothetical protein ATK30_5576 [Amycolatopsis niigatensis]
MPGFLHRFRRPALSAREQLARLSSVLDRAAAVAPETETAVRACGAAGDVPGAIGHAGSELVSTYHRLREELNSIPVDRERAPLADEIGRLLQYHQWLMRTAVQLAFSLNQDPRREAMRRRLDGVGPPAARLQALRDQVAERLRSEP